MVDKGERSKATQTTAIIKTTSVPNFNSKCTMKTHSFFWCELLFGSGPAPRCALPQTNPRPSLWAPPWVALSGKWPVCVLVEHPRGFKVGFSGLVWVIWPCVFAELHVCPDMNVDECLVSDLSSHFRLFFTQICVNCDCNHEEYGEVVQTFNWAMTESQGHDGSTTTSTH